MTKEMTNGVYAMIWTVLAVMAGYGFAPVIGWVAIPVSLFMILIVFAVVFLPTASEDREAEGVLMAVIFIFGAYGAWATIHPVVAIIIVAPILIVAIATDNRQTVKNPA